MCEYMKKALIAAVLVVSTAFVPCLSNVTDFPDRASELAHAAASPLFWQFWDELLSRELAQWAKTVSDDDQQSEWPPEFRSVLTYDRFLVSIPKCVIRCTLEGELLLVSEHWARYDFYQEESHVSGGINATKDSKDDRIKKLRAGCRAGRGVASASTGRQCTVSKCGPA